MGRYVSAVSISLSLCIVSELVSNAYSRFLESGTLRNRPRSRGRTTTKDQDHFLAQIELPQHPMLKFKGTGVSFSVETVKKNSRII